MPFHLRAEGVKGQFLSLRRKLLVAEIPALEHETGHFKLVDFDGRAVVAPVGFRTVEIRLCMSLIDLQLDGGIGFVNLKRVVGLGGDAVVDPVLDVQTFASRVLEPHCRTVVVHAKQDGAPAVVGKSRYRLQEGIADGLFELKPSVLLHSAPAPIPFPTEIQPQNRLQIFVTDFTPESRLESR